MQRLLIMAEKIHQGFKGNQKQENIPHTIRIQKREESERSKKSVKSQHLFYKRTKVYFDSNDVEDNDMLSLQDVRQLSRELVKKSDRTEKHLKMLIKAFRTDASYVNSFLEEEKSLWTLVGYFTGSDSSLQLYAAYCLTNITSVEHDYKKAVANACSSYLITYLSSEVPMKQDLCATALGNIASDGEEFCELLKVQGIIKPLVGLFKTTSPAVLEAAAFLAVKLIAGNEARTNELIEMGIGELLVKKLRKYDHDSSTIGQLAWLLFYLASNETQFSKLMQLGILDLAFVHLQNQSSAISKNVFSLTAFLRLIGNAATMVTAELRDRLSRVSLDALIKPLIDCSYIHIIKEALWATSNIIATDEKSASQMISTGMLQSFGRCLNYGEVIQEEVMICLCTISSYGGLLLEAVFYNLNLMAQCLQFLFHRNSKLVILTLQLLEMALRTQNTELLVNVNINIKSVLIELSYHENTTIMHAAKELCRLYFDYEQQDTSV